MNEAGKSQAPAPSSPPRQIVAGIKGFYEASATPS